MTRVIILDVRGLISDALPDVLRRHKEYAQSLRKLDPKSNLIVLSLQNNKSITSTDGFVLNAVESFWRFIKTGLELLGTSDKRTLLVCGDPWESFYISRLLCLLARRKLAIQVQVHADVGSSTWRRLGWKNRLRFALLKPAIRRATQIRCVSFQQLVNLKLAIGSEIEHAVIIPVPIYIEQKLAENMKEKKQNVIAFVGRIEFDRGIRELLRTIEVLHRQRLEMQVWVIGSGSQLQWLKRQAFSMGFDDKMRFLGEVSQEPLSELWPQVGCLISLAPAESYGRAPREALLHRVPILALRSSGLMELESEFKDVGMFYLDNVSDADLYAVFEKAFATLVPMAASMKIFDEVSQLSNQLANSWVSTINRF